MGRKTYEAKCDGCGKIIHISSSQYNRLKDGRQKHIYCSRECKSISQHTGHEVVCSNCGKTFYRRQQHIDRHELQFCCSECGNEYRHNESMETRVCEVCGNEFECKKNSNQKFCSQKCQNVWQTTQTEQLSKKYKRVLYRCVCCGKSFMVKHYKLEKQTEICCSDKCRHKWFKEVIAKRPEFVEKRREIALKNLQNNVYSTINSKPQAILDNILKRNSIKYEREYLIKYYAVDNYLSDSGLMIEVMGDYWHCNPTIYSCPINDTQKSRIARDKAKHTYIKNQYGVEVLYVWEHDLYYNEDICEKFILDYVRNDGVLADYHSFNYVENNKLKICNDWSDTDSNVSVSPTSA